MKLYRIKDTATGLYYRHRYSQFRGGDWVGEDRATIWTKPGGASGALGAVREKAKGKPDTFKIETATVHINWGDEPRIAFVDADDWQGIYINGKLVREGHQIRQDDLLDILGIKAQYLYADDAWLAERGRLPEHLEEVVEG